MTFSIHTIYFIEFQVVKSIMWILEPFEAAVKEMAEDTNMGLSKVIPMTKAMNQMLQLRQVLSIPLIFVDPNYIVALYPATKPVSAIPTIYDKSFLYILV